MLRVALKNLRARKVRVVTSGIAVLLGVAFVAGTMVLTDTVTSTFDDLFTEVFAGTDAFVRAEEPFDADFGGGSTRPLVDESLLDTVAAVDGVAYASPDIGGFAQIVGSDGKALGSPGQGPPTFGGNWEDNDDLNAWTVVEGEAPDADGEVIIDRRSAKEGDLTIGARTTVLTRTGPVDVTVVGIAKFGDADSPGGASYAGFTRPFAQRVMGQPGKINGVSVVAADGVSQEEVRDRIAAVLPPAHEVITGDELAQENKDDIQQIVSIFGTVMLGFALVALFVGSFIIYNTFSILVAQRTREMALFRALGASRRQVTGSLLLEALAVGLLASVLGLVAGMAVATGLKALLAAFGFDLPAAGLSVQPKTIIWSIGLGTVVSVFAAWFPARRGAKVPPLAALRDVAIEHAGRPRLRIGAGALLLALGLLSLFSGLQSDDSGTALPGVGLGALLILLGASALGPLVARPVTGALGRPVAATRGVSGVLARENARRNPRRTATTASALMIGVALVGFITIFASSAKASIDDVFNEQFTGDYVFDTHTFGVGGVSTAMAGELRALPEIGAVSPWRMTSARFDGKGVLLNAYDASELAAIADLDVQEGDLATLDATGVAVLDDKAEDEGWSIGDQVTIQFTDTGERTFTVRVIYGNNELAGRYFVDTAAFDANVSEQFDTMVFATVADGVSVADARPAIEEVVGRYANLKVQDRDEFIDAQSGEINQILAFIYVLLLLAIVIAFFGITNTLALSIVERTRELGLLRAVGMTRSQLKSMVRWEAVLIALFGTLGGLLISIFFGWAMIRALADQGFQTFQVPPFQLLVIAIVAALFGVLAAWLPARRAAKLDVLQAIATE